MESRRSKRKESASSHASRETRSKRSRRLVNNNKEADKELDKAAVNSKSLAVSSSPDAPSERRSHLLSAAAGTLPKDVETAHQSPRCSRGKQGSDKQPTDKQPMDRPNRHNRSLRNEADGGLQGGDDPHDDLGSEVFGRNFASASSALQGLLRKLGAGLDDCLPSGALTSSRVKGIILSLRQEEDEAKQLDGLTQLCELLSISTEESLTVFPVEQVVPLLVNLLNGEANPDILLLAARALTFLADVMPSSCSTIVRHGAVPAFCARLLTIEFIDLAEQSLQALEKLSHEHPQACLRNGGLLAVLSYIDFFQTGVQRVAVATAANMCRGLTAEDTDSVQSAIVILTNLLQYQDAKVVDNACLALTRIAEAFSDKPVQLESFCSCGVVASTLQLITLSENGSMVTQLSSSTYFGLIRLLATCAASSPTATELLLQSGISSTLKGLMTNSPFASSMNSSGLLSSPDQLYDVLTLVCQLLPEVPDALTAVLASASEDAPESETVEEQSAQAKFLAEHPGLLEKVVSDLLPLALQLYGGTVIQQIRKKCLEIVCKMLYYSGKELLNTVLATVPMSSFIATLLGSAEHQVVAQALQMASCLLQKLPVVFRKYFVKEGVVHALDKLASKKQEPPPPPKTKPKRTSSRLRAREKGKETEGSEAKTESSPEKSQASAPRSAQPVVCSVWPALSAYAQQLKVQYFDGYSCGAGGLETDGVVLLRKLCSQLDQPGTWAELCQVLQGQHETQISTFEFLSSGILQDLHAYLSGTTLSPPAASGLLHRLRTVLDVLFEPGTGLKPPVLGLIRKLQDCLASLENLPGTCNQLLSVGPTARLGSTSMTGGSSLPQSNSVSSGLAALSQPLKCRLSRDPSETKLREYSANVVLIEPLATMSAVEEFLWPRVYCPTPHTKPEAVPTAGRPSWRTRTQSAGGSTSTPSSLMGSPPKPPGATAKTSSRAQSVPERTGATTRAMAKQRSLDAAAAAAEAAVAFGEEDDEPMDEDVEDVIRLQADEDDGDDGVDDDDDDDDEVDADGADDEMFQGDEEDEDDDEGDGDDDDAMQVYASRAVQRVNLESSKAQQDAAPTAVPRTNPSMSYAQATEVGAKTSNDAPAATPGTSTTVTPKLTFSLNGRILAPHTDIFQAIHQAEQEALQRRDSSGDSAQLESEDSRRRTRRLWDEVYTITYRAYTPDAQVPSAQPNLASATVAASDNPTVDIQQYANSPLAELLNIRVPGELSLSTEMQSTLMLLKLLYLMNRCAHHLAGAVDGEAGTVHSQVVSYGYVPPEEFINNKIASKFGQQMKDVLAVCGGALPTWCAVLVHEFKFLFPFDMRRQFFYCTSFGVARALQYLQHTNSGEGAARGHRERDGREYRVARIQRQKVRISRKRILDSAMKVMDLYARHKAVLELEYFGEVGTGLGPTLEFYTLLSHELQRKNLGMWRHTEQPDTVPADKITAATRSGSAADLSNEVAGLYVDAPDGLFPAPLSPAQAADNTKLLDRFKLVGRTMAKALQDNRLLDIPLSYMFYRKALGHKLDLFDVRKVDAALGATLEKLHAAVSAHKAGGGSTALVVDGCNVEDLCLMFVLPGYPQYELKPNGAEIAVTSQNVEEYINAVVDATVGTGIAPQMGAFQKGFNEVFQLSTLGVFSSEEIEHLLCGTTENWTVEMLCETIKFDHGYTAQCSTVRNFLEILSELDSVDQRRFLRFVTGSPRLPPGGIAALQPRLTVVRKHSSHYADGSGTPSAIPPSGGLICASPADGDLPSVMTCANYIKLPLYSSKDVMRERVCYAIREGQGSFDLS